MYLQCDFYPFADSQFHTEHRHFENLNRENGVALRLIERGYGPDARDIAALVNALIGYHLSICALHCHKHDHEWANFSQDCWEALGLPVERMHALARELIKLGVVESSPELDPNEPASTSEPALYRLDFDRAREFLDTSLRRDGWPPEDYHDDAFIRYVLTQRATMRLLEMGFWDCAFGMADTLARLDELADEGAIGEWHDLKMDDLKCEAEALTQLGLLERKAVGKRTIYRLNRKAFRQFASAPFSREPHDSLPREVFVEE